MFRFKFEGKSHGWDQLFAERDVLTSTWGRSLGLSFPIDGDEDVEEAFVHFLGDRALYERCCAEAELDDNAIDPNGLTVSERLAIWIYSSTDDDWYERINDELWHPPESAEVAALSQLINAALQKLPVHAGLTYRGYYAADLDPFLAMFEPTAVIRWPGFTSSSVVPEKAFSGNILFAIRSQNGRILGLYADKPDEEEVLFKSGSRFVVVSVERREDLAVIELEELSP